MTKQEIKPKTPEIIVKESRGAQLRALVLSWKLNETYQRTLQIQAEELQNGELQVDDDWTEIADQLFQAFKTQKSQIIMP